MSKTSRSNRIAGRSLAIAGTLAVLALATALASAKSTRPNFIVVFCDNLGYGDVGCFGSTHHRTPNLDQMAAEGMRLTSFYSTSGVCTPSRASLLTGCYPRRVGLDRTEPDGAVLRPVSPNGLNPNEVTVAEVLKKAGYHTACIGKWHLGDQLEFLPTRQGFDSYFGIPYSDDMTPRAGRNWPPLPLLRNERVIEAPTDRNLLTRRLTEEAVRIIRDPTVCRSSSIWHKPCRAVPNGHLQASHFRAAVLTAHMVTPWRNLTGPWAEYSTRCMVPA